MEKLPKINIIYEDNHLLVIEKPVGIPVQADSSNAIDLITLLKEYRIKNENKKGNAYIGLVHRLDRPVGGIMVFAKTSKAASRLSDEIRKNNFHKTYYAVVEGTLPKEGKFEDYLIKNEKENISYVTTKEKMERAIVTIEQEMEERVKYFKSQNKLIEAQRIEERTNFDIEMMKETGFCSGIENYSRHISRKTRR